MLRLQCRGILRPARLGTTRSPPHPRNIQLAPSVELSSANLSIRIAMRSGSMIQSLRIRQARTRESECAWSPESCLKCHRASLFNDTLEGLICDALVNQRVNNECGLALFDLSHPCARMISMALLLTWLSRLLTRRRSEDPKRAESPSGVGSSAGLSGRRDPALRGREADGRSRQLSTVLYVPGRQKRHLALARSHQSRADYVPSAKGVEGDNSAFSIGCCPSDTGLMAYKIHLRTKYIERDKSKRCLYWQCMHSVAGNFECNIRPDSVQVPVSCCHHGIQRKSYARSLCGSWRLRVAHRFSRCSQFPTYYRSRDARPAGAT